jgi:hypothetical protein
MSGRAAGSNAGVFGDDWVVSALATDGAWTHVLWAPREGERAHRWQCSEVVGQRARVAEVEGVRNPRLARASFPLSESDPTPVPEIVLVGADSNGHARVWRAPETDAGLEGKVGKTRPTRVSGRTKTCVVTSRADEPPVLEALKGPLSDRVLSIVDTHTVTEGAGARTAALVEHRGHLFVYVTRRDERHVSSLGKVRTYYVPRASTLGHRLVRWTGPDTLCLLGDRDTEEQFYALPPEVDPRPAWIRGPGGPGPAAHPLEPVPEVRRRLSVALAGALAPTAHMEFVRVLDVVGDDGTLDLLCATAPLAPASSESAAHGPERYAPARWATVRVSDLHSEALEAVLLDSGATPRSEILPERYYTGASGLVRGALGPGGGQRARVLVLASRAKQAAEYPDMMFRQAVDGDDAPLNTPAVYFVHAYAPQNARAIAKATQTRGAAGVLVESPAEKRVRAEEPEAPSLPALSALDVSVFHLVAESGARPARRFGWLAGPTRGRTAHAVFGRDFEPRSSCERALSCGHLGDTRIVAESEGQHRLRRAHAWLVDDYSAFGDLTSVTPLFAPWLQEARVVPCSLARLPDVGESSPVSFCFGNGDYSYTLIDGAVWVERLTPDAPASWPLLVAPGEPHNALGVLAEAAGTATLTPLGLVLVSNAVVQGSEEHAGNVRLASLETPHDLVLCVALDLAGGRLLYQLVHCVNGLLDAFATPVTRDVSSFAAALGHEPARHGRPALRATTAGLTVAWGAHAVHVAYADVPVATLSSERESTHVVLASGQRDRVALHDKTALHSVHDFENSADYPVKLRRPSGTRDRLAAAALNGDRLLALTFISATGELALEAYQLKDGAYDLDSRHSVPLAAAATPAGLVPHTLAFTCGALTSHWITTSGTLVFETDAPAHAHWIPWAASAAPYVGPGPGAALAASLFVPHPRLADPWWAWLRVRRGADPPGALEAAWLLRAAALPLGYAPPVFGRHGASGGGGALPGVVLVPGGGAAGAREARALELEEAAPVGEETDGAKRSRVGVPPPFDLPTRPDVLLVNDNNKLVVVGVSLLVKFVADAVAARSARDGWTARLSRVVSLVSQFVLYHTSTAYFHNKWSWDLAKPVLDLGPGWDFTDDAVFVTHLARLAISYLYFGYRFLTPAPRALYRLVRPSPAHVSWKGAARPKTPANLGRDLVTPTHWMPDSPRLLRDVTYGPQGPLVPSMRASRALLRASDATTRGADGIEADRQRRGSVNKTSAASVAFSQSLKNVSAVVKLADLVVERDDATPVAFTGSYAVACVCKEEVVEADDDAEQFDESITTWTVCAYRLGVPISSGAEDLVCYADDHVKEVGSWVLPSVTEVESEDGFEEVPLVVGAVKAVAPDAFLVTLYTQGSPGATSRLAAAFLVRFSTPYDAEIAQVPSINTLRAGPRGNAHFLAATPTAAAFDDTKRGNAATPSDCVLATVPNACATADETFKEYPIIASLAHQAYKKPTRLAPLDGYEQTSLHFAPPRAESTAHMLAVDSSAHHAPGVVAGALNIVGKVAGGVASAAYTVSTLTVKVAKVATSLTVMLPTAVGLAGVYATDQLFGGNLFGYGVAGTATLLGANFLARRKTPKGKDSVSTAHLSHTDRPVLQYLGNGPVKRVIAASQRACAKGRIVILSSIQTPGPQGRYVFTECDVLTERETAFYPVDESLSRQLDAHLAQPSCKWALVHRNWAVALVAMGVDFCHVFNVFLAGAGPADRRAVVFSHGVADGDFLARFAPSGLLALDIGDQWTTAAFSETRLSNKAAGVPQNAKAAFLRLGWALAPRTGNKALPPPSNLWPVYVGSDAGAHLGYGSLTPANSRVVRLLALQCEDVVDEVRALCELRDENTNARFLAHLVWSPRSDGTQFPAAPRAFRGPDASIRSHLPLNYSIQRLSSREDEDHVQAPKNASVSKAARGRPTYSNTTDIQLEKERMKTERDVQVARIRQETVLKATELSAEARAQQARELSAFKRGDREASRSAKEAELLLKTQAAESKEARAYEERERARQEARRLKVTELEHRRKEGGEAYERRGALLQAQIESKERMLKSIQDHREHMVATEREFRAAESLRMETSRRAQRQHEGEEAYERREGLLRLQHELREMEQNNAAEDARKLRDTERQFKRELLELKMKQAAIAIDVALEAKHEAQVLFLTHKTANAERTLESRQQNLERAEALRSELATAKRLFDAAEAKKDREQSDKQLDLNWKNRFAMAEMQTGLRGRGSALLPAFHFGEDPVPSSADERARPARPSVADLNAVWEGARHMAQEALRRE